MTIYDEFLALEIIFFSLKISRGLRRGQTVREQNDNCRKVNIVMAHAALGLIHIISNIENI